MKTKWETQLKVKLTMEDIENTTPNSIIMTGEAYIEHPWFNHAKENIDDDGRSVKVNYVIYRGGVVDWCIYHSLDANLEMADNLDGLSHLLRSFKDVMKHGAKPQREKIIRGIVDCTDDVYKLYRN